MHDPCCQAFEIPNIFVRKDKHGYRPALITIWHHDPERDGTDDSCGWFIRSRHIEKELLRKVRADFRNSFDEWFDKNGAPKFTCIGITVGMYQRASWSLQLHRTPDGRRTDSAWRKHLRFMRKHIAEIIAFAENDIDSLHSSITYKFGTDGKDYSLRPNRDERANWFADIVLADILRKERPWYRHPRWHIHHWDIQFSWWQNFYRRYFLKCCVCGKRGFKGSPHSNWQGTQKWHSECDQTMRTGIGGMKN